MSACPICGFVCARFLLEVLRSIDSPTGRAACRPPVQDFYGRLTCRPPSLINYNCPGRTRRPASHTSIAARPGQRPSATWQRTSVARRTCRCHLKMKIKSELHLECCAYKWVSIWPAYYLISLAAAIWYIASLAF